MLLTAFAYGIFLHNNLLHCIIKSIEKAKIVKINNEREIKVKRQYTFIITQGHDNYYIATVPELPGVITQAKEVQELFPRIKEAIEVYLEVVAEDNSDVNAESIKLVGVNNIEVEVS